MIPALIIYTQFFSRIPIHKEVDFNILAKGIRWMTLFGFLLGCLTASIFAISQWLFPLPIAWVIALTTDILLTAGFHYDALADTADGLFSSRKKERMLDIMKDSRVGSNGVLALILFFLLFYVSMQHWQLAIWQHIILVATLSMIGKAGLALQLVNMVYARSETGLGHVFCQAATQDILLAQILPILVSIAVFGLKGIVAYSLVAIVSVVYRRFVYQKIQGQTGDTIGAFVLIAQIVYSLSLTLSF